MNFTRCVLGQKATERLQAHQVTQTIRSGSSSFVLAINDSRIKPDELMQVALDGEFIGSAELVGMDRLKADELSIDDAKRGGFAIALNFSLP